MKKTNPALFPILAALLLSACGKIPSPYRGDFVDAASGTKLTLRKNSGTLATRAGRVLTSDAYSLDFDSLLKGRPGIHVRPNESDPDEIEVFWILPDLATRGSENDFVWMDAEILYSRLDTRAKDPVLELKMIHCENGMILLDLPSKTWNGGCPAERTDLDFIRAAPRR